MKEGAKKYEIQVPYISYYTFDYLIVDLWSINDKTKLPGKFLAPSGALVVMMV